MSRASSSGSTVLGRLDTQPMLQLVVETADRDAGYDELLKHRV